MHDEAGAPQTLVILKANQTSLKSAEAYLQNREWNIISSANLRDALAGILQRQPKFVLLAADHPNKKVLKMPQLLAQAFPCHVIGFTESSSNVAMMTLQNMGLEYNLYPPISGPSIERLIHKIIKDEELRAQNLEQNRLTANENASLSNPNEVPLNALLTQARNTLSQLLAEDSDDNSPDSQMFHSKGPSSLTEPGFIIQKGMSVETLVSNQDPTDPTAKGPPSAYDSDWSQHQITQEGFKLSVAGSGVGQKNEESIIQKATATVLEEMSLPKATQNIERIAESSQLACMVIESTHFNGYLVAALGKNRSLDETFINSMQDRLYAFLKKHGDLPQDENKIALNLKIQQIEFEDWALQQALFLKKTIHGNEEIAMAFFPTDETKVRLETSAHEKMVKTLVADLREDIPLEFDLYVYLPENQKFLLYTPQGSPLFHHQKIRLLDKGVQYLHLLKESISNLRRFHAQNFLNDKIKDYLALKKP